MGEPLSILVTGSAGRLGRAAVRELIARRHRVRGFDRVRTPGLADGGIIGDIADGAAVRKAVAGMQTVIHLAATPDDSNYPRGAPPNDGDNFLSELVPNNIVATYHMLEACRIEGVRRVVLASSGQVGWEQSEIGPFPITAEMPPTPRYWYAATKMFLEAAGFSYAKHHNLGVLAIRLGWCPRDKGQEREIAESERAQDVYLSPGDAGRFFACAVEAPGVTGFHILYATSRPKRTLRHDLAAAQRLIGFEPRETWPEGLQ